MSPKRQQRQERWIIEARSEAEKVWTSEFHPLVFNQKLFPDPACNVAKSIKGYVKFLLCFWSFVFRQLFTIKRSVSSGLFVSDWPRGAAASPPQPGSLLPALFDVYFKI